MFSWSKSCFTISFTTRKFLKFKGNFIILRTHMTGSIFQDKQDRYFIPYKGWCVQLENGEYLKDNLLDEPEGPFHIVVDTLSHGNWHTTYNLENDNGHKLLSKGVRSIKYFLEGYYLLEDNNEDELINRGDVKGGFRAADYIERYNVMRNDGTLLSDKWFDRLSKDLGYFKAKLDGHHIRLYLSGKIEFIHEPYLDFGCQVVEINHELYIQNSKGDNITPCCSSIMWASKKVWEVEILHDGKFKSFLHGQGNGVISYLHEILILNNTIAIIENNNVWYKLDSLGKTTEILKFDTEAIMGL